ncbi:M60 family metallopeptidase, partial [Vibrio owensii]|uniref:M60 family metallopeptidase n=1 Tax=Vibrio owensii TaxID=696485 RepID=UPI00391F16E4
ELMFDGEHSTHMRIAEGTPNYVNIDLGENIDINALVYTPQKEGYSGRIKDFLVYGSSDNEEWRLIASRTIPHGDGNAPHIAFAGEQSELQQVEKSYQVRIRPDNAIERDRLKNSQGRSRINVTGLFFDGPSTLSIWVDNVDESDFLEISNGVWGGSTRYPLNQGLNSLTFGEELYPAHNEGVPLYIQISSNDTKDNERHASVRVMASDVEYYPVFKSGLTTQNEWTEMLSTYSNPDRLEMVGEHMMVEFNKYAFSPYQDTDMQELSDTYEEVLTITEKAAGIDPSHELTIHHPDDNPYHFISNQAGYMAAANGFMFYNTDLTYRMIEELKTIYGWGIWHEVGHNLQMKGLNWSGQGEVSVNIYAFAARAYNTPLNELVTMYDPEFTKAFNNLTQVLTYSELERASREMMFHHMFFVFGETVMHDLHQRYRENMHGEINDPEFEIGSTDEEQMNVMAMMASKTTETNLVPFFEFWKFPLTQATIDTINGYGFPELQEFDQLPSELVSGNPPEMYDMKF